jgi:hypothetical protein
MERSANSHAQLEFADARGNTDGTRGKSIPLRLYGTVPEEKWADFSVVFFGPRRGQLRRFGRQPYPKMDNLSLKLP